MYDKNMHFEIHFCSNIAWKIDFFAPLASDVRLGVSKTQSNESHDWNLEFRSVRTVTNQLQAEYGVTTKTVDKNMEVFKLY